MTRVVYVVTGGPDGDVRHEVEGPGPGSAEVTFTAPHALWARITAGDVEPAVAFMQGRLKMAGDQAAIYDLLPAFPLPDGS
ncbi:MAG TPA: SCP2 sterol-binding domain-containing protein [Acidimicrobiales bacterium]|nr:SCP2 sterol-binding domain-containing protein [Acidimicrobiales bacterium]